MLAIQQASTMHSPSSSWLQWLDTVGGGGWQLEPSPRCLSVNGGKDMLAGRHTALHAVQLSACSDSALLGKAHRHSHGHSSSHGDSGAGLRPPRALLNASAASLLSSQLQQIHTWDRFDVFRVSELTHGRPLYTVAITIFEALGLLNWKLDRRKVEAFFMAAEAAYGRGNPYHNSTHAADVVQAAFIMLRSVEQPQFTKLEVFGLLVAAIVHDIAHPGVTNDFLVKTGHPLIEKHGCASANEKHHLATAFGIAANEETNIFAGLSPAEAEQARSFVYSAVLCTDMAQHTSLSERLSDLRHRCRDPGVPVDLPGQHQQPTCQQHSRGSTSLPGDSHPLADTSSTPQLAAAGQRYTPADKALLLRALLHTADLSNPARPLPLGASWGHLVAKEFLAQGDVERQLGLDVTPACDRNTVVVSTSQLRFISMFLRPLLQQMQGFLGQGLHAQLLKRLAETEEHWRHHQALLQAGNLPSGP